MDVTQPKMGVLYQYITSLQNVTCQNQMVICKINETVRTNFIVILYQTCVNCIHNEYVCH